MVRPREVRAVDLPAAQAELARMARLELRADRAVTPPQGDEDNVLADLYKQITRPDFGLWWISRPMTVLAAHEAKQIPEWDGPAVWPRQAGLMAWQGGTGIHMPVYLPDLKPRSVEVFGLLWWRTRGGQVTETQTLVRAADAERAGADTGGMSLLTVIFHPLPPLAPENAGKDVEKRVADLWATSAILATQPRVGAVHARRLTNPPGLPGKPRKAPRISVAVLREEEQPAPDRPSDEKSTGEGKWHLTSRHPVRGHWRQQACGPGRSLRRPVYVLPYMKGPKDAPVKETPRVNVWRRL